MKQEKAVVKLNEKPVQCPLCLGWFEKRWNPIRKMLFLFCHFDGIAIAANDPFVGRWDEFYALSGDVMNCLACDHKMRFFGTSTGYVQFKCPKKKCRAKIERVAPDREAGRKLVNQQGQEIDTTGIDRAISTPDDPADLQVAGEEAPDKIPETTFVPLPQREGHA